MGSNGIKPIQGTFTPNTEGLQTISYGRTVNKYFILIELSDESKFLLINEGIDANKAYAFWSIYPKPSINSKSPSNNVMTYARFNAQTDSASSSDTSVAMSTTDIKINAYPITASSGTALIVGYTYNWTVIPLE